MLEILPDVMRGVERNVRRDGSWLSLCLIFKDTAGDAYSY